MEGAAPDLVEEVLPNDIAREVARLAVEDVAFDALRAQLLDEAREPGPAKTRKNLRLPRGPGPRGVPVSSVCSKMFPTPMVSGEWFNMMPAGEVCRRLRAERRGSPCCSSQCPARLPLRSAVRRRRLNCGLCRPCLCPSPSPCSKVGKGPPPPCTTRTRASATSTWRTGARTGRCSRRA